MSTDDTIMTFITEELSQQRPPEQLTATTQLLENEVIDSMGIIQIVGFIEDEYGIVLDDDDLSVDNFATVAAISALIEEKRTA